MRVLRLNTTPPIPRIRSKRSKEVQKPASSLVLMRVFCFLGRFWIHWHPIFLGAHLGAYPDAPKMDAPKMPKTITPLTDTQVRNAKAKDKTYRLFDGGGLYLEVTATGSKLWRMKFKQALSALLKTEAAKSRKQRRTLKQSHEDLKELGFEGPYDRVAAFARVWRAGQSDRVDPASKRTTVVHLSEMAPHICDSGDCAFGRTCQGDKSEGRKYPTKIQPIEFHELGWQNGECGASVID